MSISSQKRAIWNLVGNETRSVADKNFSIFSSCEGIVSGFYTDRSRVSVRLWDAYFLTTLDDQAIHFGFSKQIPLDFEQFDRTSEALKALKLRKSRASSNEIFSAAIDHAVNAHLRSQCRFHVSVLRQNYAQASEAINEANRLSDDFDSLPWWSETKLLMKRFTVEKNHVFDKLSIRNLAFREKFL